MKTVAQHFFGEMPIKYFNVCDGTLLPDLMHDILEGALQYEVKLMLQVMINVEGYFR